MKKCLLVKSVTDKLKKATANVRIVVQFFKMRKMMSRNLLQETLREDHQEVGLRVVLHAAALQGDRQDVALQVVLHAAALRVALHVAALQGGRQEAALHAALPAVALLRVQADHRHPPNQVAHQAVLQKALVVDHHKMGQKAALQRVLNVAHQNE